jgi:mono/diheme cytochrome c family protein
MMLAPALLLLALAGCRGDPEEVPVPFTGTDGTALYAQACSSCHGVDLRGTEQGPPFLHPVYRPGHHSDAAFVLAVRRGSPAHHWNFGPMPPVAGLSDEQVDAIIRYVRAQQQATGIE